MAMACFVHLWDWVPWPRITGERYQSSDKDWWNLEGRWEDDRGRARQEACERNKVQLDNADFHIYLAMPGRLQRCQGRHARRLWSTWKARHGSLAELITLHDLHAWFGGSHQLFDHKQLKVQQWPWITQAESFKQQIQLNLCKPFESAFDRIPDVPSTLF